MMKNVTLSLLAAAAIGANLDWQRLRHAG